MTHAIGDVLLLEIGNGEFFPGLAKNYGPIAVRAGTVLQVELDRWIEAIDRSISENTFFASCNYVTYGLVKAMTAWPMSAIGAKADMAECTAHVCFSPKADMCPFRTCRLIRYDDLF